MTLRDLRATRAAPRGRSRRRRWRTGRTAPAALPGWRPTRARDAARAPRLFMWMRRRLNERTARVELDNILARVRRRLAQPWTRRTGRRVDRL